MIFHAVNDAGGGVSVFRIRFRYLYAGTEKAADEAGQVAREALTLDGRVAESSLL